MSTRADEDILRLLEGADLDILGLLPNSSNYTFLAKTEGADDVLVVYKPRAGEAPLWDFPEGTLCQREVAAFLVADALGWPRVPPTVLRDGPEGPGSVQLFLEFDPDEHYFTLAEGRAQDFRRIAAYDAVVNNADRKAGHCLLATAPGDVFVIDHGVCFHESPKLRTVIWEFAGQPIEEALLDDLAGLREELRAGALGPTLAPLLSSDELTALDSRTERLVRTGRFPQPGPGRPYPWPAI